MINIDGKIVNKFIKEKNKSNKRYIIWKLIFEDGEELIIEKNIKIIYICKDCRSENVHGFNEQYINKDYYCNKCRLKGEKNPFYGKIHSKETKEKISKKNKINSSGKNNGMYGKSLQDVWVKKYGNKATREKQKKLSENLSKACAGEKNGFYNKTHSKETIKKIKEKNAIWYNNLSKEEKQLLKLKMSDGQKRFKENNPEYYKLIKQKAAYISLKNQSHYKKNEPEKKLEKIFKQNHIDVEYSIIMGKYQYDFKVKNKRILIEMNGIYWHGCDRYYNIDGSNGLKKLNETQLKKIKKDKSKKDFAINNNFKLFVIWDDELDNEDKLESLINEIKKN